MDKKCSYCENLNCNYICPKCGIFYCSLNCYRNQQHLNCTELFYKEQVLLHLSTHPNQKEIKKKTLQLLQKLNLNNEKDYEEEHCLAVDDDNHEMMAKKKQQAENDQQIDDDYLENILTPEEKKKFKLMIESGSIFNLLPSNFWDPWYLRYTKSLIQEIDVHNEDQQKDNQNSNNDEEIPKHPCFDTFHLTKYVQNSSPLIRFNIINTILSYCYVCRYFTGDYHLNANEAYSLLLESSILSNKEIICENCSNALQITWRRLIEQKSTPLCFIKQLLTDTCYIIQNGNDLILRILNDIIELSLKVTKPFNSSQAKPKVIIKKIQFYIAWCQMYQDLIKQELNAVKLEFILISDSQVLSVK